MSKYYYLIAGLPELALEDNKLNFTIDSFKAELYPELSKRDKKLIDLYYLQYDNQNLLALISDKEAALEREGVYGAEELLRLIECVKLGEEKIKGNYPKYFITFLEKYFSEESIDPVKAENMIVGMYLDFAMSNRNKFIAEWYQFNALLNNLQIALIGRKYQQEYQSQIIGNDVVSSQIRQSSARDFGLSTTIDFLPNLMRIIEEENLLLREKKIDALKWSWMEDKIFFDYFTIERVFVFLLQIDMIERWLQLDSEEGNRYFREIIDSLKNQVQITEEFRKN